MEKKTNRLYFIDAMRAWAILMMLQGHFVDGLLDPIYRDPENMVFRVWLYFRGITAPVFFTVSGFIFTYLLIRIPQAGFENPRVAKGIRRGLQLLFIGYLLRLNLFGLMKGEVYDSFYLVDVLHCIGLSILGVIAVYLLTAQKKSWIFPSALLAISLLLFLFEPFYKELSYPMLPDAIENYITKVNGSVFTIFPWFGYATFGAFLSVLFTRFKEARYLYPAAIGLSLLSGTALVYLSSPLFAALANWSGIELFSAIYSNNYLFIRLGNVMVVFAIFMMLRRYLTNSTLLKLGQNTLSIYVIHFVVLYGSLTGLGVYYFLNYSVSATWVIPGALAFMMVCSYAALQYDLRENQIKEKISASANLVLDQAGLFLLDLHKFLKSLSARLLKVLGLIKS